MGAFVNNLLAAAIGGMIIILNLGLGDEPGAGRVAAGALPRLTDALTDPLMGFISDNTRSRWGRRRPYIFIGAITRGSPTRSLACCRRAQTEMFYFWYFLIGSTIFYVALHDLRDAVGRARLRADAGLPRAHALMGVQNFIGQLAYVVSPWFLWIMTHKAWFADPRRGRARARDRDRRASPSRSAFCPRSSCASASRTSTPAAARSAAGADGGGAARNMREFFKGFAHDAASKPFLKLCAATFLVFNGFIMISSFQSYVIIYYVFGGDQELGAKYAGYSGTLAPSPPSA